MKINHGKNFNLMDKRSVFIDKSVKIGNNVTIYENCRIIGNTTISDGATIYPNCFIVDCFVGENATITSSHCEDAVIGSKCSIGPFARLRPKTKLNDNVKVGNFVEIKNANVGDGSKISHLAYVGDADRGKNCNVGCGAIFVNYNGKTKSRSSVGDDCFIGSNCNVIAPVTIKNGAYVCAGTTVTDDVNADDFIIGRVRQQAKENRAHLYLKRKEGEK